MHDIAVGLGVTMRLAVKLPLLVMTTILVGSSIGGSLIVSSTADSVRTQAIEASRHSAAAYASAVSSFLDDAKSLLEIARNDPRVSGIDWKASRDPSGYGVRATEARGARTVARGLLGRSRLFEYVQIVDRRGGLFLAEPYAVQVRARAGDMSTLPWYRRVMRTGLPVISDLHVAPLTGSPSVVVALPMRDRSGRVFAVWAGGLRLSVFSGVGRVPTAPGTRDAAGFLTDRRGAVIAHHSRPDFVRDEKSLLTLPPVARALSGRSGAGEWLDADGRSTLGAYEPLPGWGWAVVYATAKATALKPARALARDVIVTIAAVALLTAGLVLVMTRRLVRPVNRLVEVADRIGAGDLKARADDVGGPLEVRHLAETFDAMAVALNERDAALRDHARRLNDTNRDLKRKNQELDAKNDEVESFAYSVAHDLRTPLRSITAFGDILATQCSDGLDSDGRHYLEMVNTGGHEMGRIIDELLELSRVGRSAVRPVTCDVSALAHKILGQLRRNEPQREVELVVAAGLGARADPGLLEVVLANLLGNAWKFTGGTADARIEVDAGPEAGAFVVRDNGVGFDMAYAGKLFEPFRRLHAKEDFPGSGIGLATAARIVRMHGGRIWAESEPGRGAAFFVAFEAPPNGKPVESTRPRAQERVT